MTAGEYIKIKLEHDFIGKKIKNWNNTCEFVVTSIKVEDGGPDPQWEMNLHGKNTNETFSISFCHDKMPEIVKIVEEEDLDNMDLHPCPQCGEEAWDDYICHSCGAKNI